MQSWRRFFELAQTKLSYSSPQSWLKLFSAEVCEISLSSLLLSTAAPHHININNSNINVSKWWRKKYSQYFSCYIYFAKYSLQLHFVDIKMLNFRATAVPQAF